MAERISVGTVAFNNLDELKLTLESVDSQTRLPDLHLIMDGSSNREIKDYLEQSEQPAYRKWICEPDENQSDAFNKIVQHIDSGVIHLLNSGDYYYDKEAIARSAEAFEKDPSLMWTHGQYLQHRGGGWVISGKPFEKEKLYRGMRQVAHPTMFVKKEVYNRVGLFSLEKDIAMDYDFIVRLADEKVAYLNYPITCFEPGGKSETRQREGHQDMIESYAQYRGNPWKMKLWLRRVQFLNWVTKTWLGQKLFQLKHSANRVNKV